ncbi:hypothetical protein TSMEX_003592 [Taenia solium]|eukprot:TsM_000992000 transcript=TsM_000992000 gene=TsM_000992000
MNTGMPGEHEEVGSTIMFSTSETDEVNMSTVFSDVDNGDGNSNDKFDDDDYADDDCVDNDDDDNKNKTTMSMMLRPGNYNRDGADSDAA